MEAHTMLALDMLMKSLFVASSADLGIYGSITFNDRFMIIAMTCTATGSFNMGATLPLHHSSRGLLFVTLNAIIRKSHRVQAQAKNDQTEQTQQKTHRSFSLSSSRYSAWVISPLKRQWRKFHAFSL
jgi:hypothetical protein